MKKLASVHLSTSAHTGFVEGAVEPGSEGLCHGGSELCPTCSPRWQQVKDFSNYMSKVDMEVLGGTLAGLACKLDQVVHRMLKVHLRMPSEPSLHAVLSAAINGGLVCGDRTLMFVCICICGCSFLSTISVFYL